MSAELAASPPIDGAKARVPQMIRPLQLAAAALGALGAITSMAWLVLTLFMSDVRLFEAAAFGAVSLVAAGFAVSVPAGSVRQGPGLGLLTIAGAFIAGALFGYIAASASLGADLLRPAQAWAATHAVIGAGFAGVSGLAVLSRRPIAWKRLAIGLGFGIGTVAVVAGFFIGLRAGMSGIVLVIAGLLGGLVTIGLASTAGHWLIRAFESGHPEEIAPAGLCQLCRYNLDGLPAGTPCPECGTGTARD